MAQADAIEVSAKELMSKLPEEIPEEEWEARKEGNSFIFPYLSIFLLPSSLIRFSSLMVKFFLSELMEEIDLDTFLKEDQATLAKRGRESVARVVGEL